MGYKSVYTSLWPHISKSNESKNMIITLIVETKIVKNFRWNLKTLVHFWQFLLLSFPFVFTEDG